MAEHSTYHQHSFLGGSWAPQAQGRIDDRDYHTALQDCINFIPMEEGSLTRRSGSKFMGPTYLRRVAKLHNFTSTGNVSYTCEFTSNTAAGEGHLQIWTDDAPVWTDPFRTVSTSSSSGGVLSIVTTASHGWSVGDHIFMVFPTTMDEAKVGPYVNRVFNVHAQDGTTGLTLYDDKDAVLPYDSASNDLTNAKLYRIKRFTTSYTDASLVSAIRMVQAQNYGIVLSSQAAPYTLTNTTDQVDTTTAGVFTFAATSFVDGPYLDQQGTFQTPETGVLTGGFSGAGLTFTPATTTFVASDVGRHIRMFSEPAAYVAATTYTAGDFVTDLAGGWWEFIYTSNLSGVYPGTSTTISDIAVYPWAPAPAAGWWGWGTITAQATTSCTVTLTTAVNSANGTTITKWRLGVFKSGQYPTCGLLYKGRLALAGAVANRIDLSMANLPFSFSPTDVFGNVLDHDAISYTINSKDLNTFSWMEADQQGFLAGSLGGVWLFHASDLNDPLTPRSFDADQVDMNGAAFVEPCRPGIATLYVHRLKLRVVELIADAFSQRFMGNTLNERAKHLMSDGVTELAFQAEKVPILWAITTDGNLAGCTYRRTSRFATENPVYRGWHQHLLADGDRDVISIAVGKCSDGLNDHLWMCTKDASSDYWIEHFIPLFEN